MMKKASLTLVLTITCLLLSAFPALAGEWKQTEDDQWQYILDDGSMATGWLEIDEEIYFFDSKGNRKSDCWKRKDGGWYHLDEDGILDKNTWVDNYYVDNDGRFIKKR